MSTLSRSPSLVGIQQPSLGVGDMDSSSFNLLMNPKKRTPSVHSAASSVSEKSRRSYRISTMPAEGSYGFKTHEQEVEDQQAQPIKARTGWMSLDADDEKSSTVSSVRSQRNTSAGQDAKMAPQKDDGDRLARRPKNEVDAMALKRELLYEFDRLRTKGIRLPRVYSLDTPLEEMQGDFLRLKRNRELDAGVMFQRQALMMCVSGIEFMSSTFSPFDCKLEGWSHHVSDSIDSYDDVLEELYLKYRGSAKMAPELRLLMALGGSAIMFSMQNRIASMAESMMRGDDGPPAQPKRTGGGAGGGGGILGMIGNLFGGGIGQAFGQPSNQPTSNQPRQNLGTPTQQQQNQQPAYQAAAPLRGPSLNVDGVLKSLQQNAFDKQRVDRVEIISTVSESDVPDDASILSGAFPVLRPTPT